MRTNRKQRGGWSREKGRCWHRMGPWGERSKTTIRKFTVECTGKQSDRNKERTNSCESDGRSRRKQNGKTKDNTGFTHSEVTGREVINKDKDTHHYYHCLWQKPGCVPCFWIHVNTCLHVRVCVYVYTKSANLVRAQSNLSWNHRERGTPETRTTAVTRTVLGQKVSKDCGLRAESMKISAETSQIKSVGPGWMEKTNQYQVKICRLRVFVPEHDKKLRPTDVAVGAR